MLHGRAGPQSDMKEKVSQIEVDPPTSTSLSPNSLDPQHFLNEGIQAMRGQRPM